VVGTLQTRTGRGFSPLLTVEHGSLLDGLACTYVDRTVRDLQWIGSAHERAAEQGLRVRNGFVLRTCERVEVYSALGEAASRSAHPLGDLAIGLAAPEAVRRRLSEIAAGVSSRLLGERFIVGQVERAGRSLPQAHPLGHVVAEAVRVARQVRDAHGFAAPADYPDLIEQGLGGATRERSASLVVVGSGVLTRAAMTHRLARRYERILPVTRSVKRLRKRMSDIGAGLPVCSPVSVWEELDGSGWDVVIATTNLDEPYRAQLGELVADKRCRVAVDVSSVPLHPTPLDDRYHNLYGPLFSAVISEQNSIVEDVAERVRAAIAAAYSEQPR
jgi:glutamyl-tRNA reductase